jgi:hypothetical protein
MFGPEGYINFSQMTEFVRDWAYKAYLAHLLEQEKKSPITVFQAEEDGDRMLLGFRHIKLKEADPSLSFDTENPAWAAHIQAKLEDDFLVTVSFHCMLAKVLKHFDTLVASPDGKVIRPDEYVFLHLDRLDWIYPSWPIRKTNELRSIIDLFDEGKFDGYDLSKRYCFLDFSLGTITKKNNSISGFRRCSHFGDDELSDRYVKTHVEPFVSWAVVWNEKNFPENSAQFFEDIGVVKERWKIPETLRNTYPNGRAKPKKGAKPTGAKEEFFRRYPDGKPEELSAEAIAAELTEAGFTISGRQILNYEKERKT